MVHQLAIFNTFHHHIPQNMLYNIIAKLLFVVRFLYIAAPFEMA